MPSRAEIERGAEALYVTVSASAVQVRKGKASDRGVQQLLEAREITPIDKLRTELEASPVLEPSSRLRRGKRELVL